MKCLSLMLTLALSVNAINAFADESLDYLTDEERARYAIYQAEQEVERLGRLVETAKSIAEPLEIQVDVPYTIGPTFEKVTLQQLAVAYHNAKINLRACQEKLEEIIRDEDQEDDEDVVEENC